MLKDGERQLEEQWPKILKFLHSLAASTVAKVPLQASDHDELVSVAMVEVVRVAKTFEPGPAAFSTFAYAVARRKMWTWAMQEARRRARLVVLPDDSLLSYEDGSSRNVLTAVATVPNVHLVFAMADGYSTYELAAQEGCSPTALQARLATARRSAKKVLVEQGFVAPDRYGTKKYKRRARRVRRGSASRPASNLSAEDVDRIMSDLDELLP